jgi:hypothetical protein
MTMTTTTRRTELAHRMSDGIDVYLFWSEPTSRVTVGASLTRERVDSSALEVEGRHALDVVNHHQVIAPGLDGCGALSRLIAQAASWSGAPACRASATLIAE